ncbi:hypothetical protein P4646_05275 [Peribacillus simplex]|uniref:hypothetical protein n=1 Tax=Peribacillus TaxID=2675229 RepID=UPI002E1B3999|nr:MULTISPECIES: hypothetical protein [Peribacillus]MED3690289.1 hypothetical protein [Peribacillus butanolivorans]MED3983486.1 hypothetical protein [Peribacillus simplex]MED4096993.1 hypothetical protein [Peribacillus simplex]
MKKVYFTLFAEHIEFDTDEQKIEKEKLIEYTFFSDSLTREDIEYLFIKIMEIKLDWMDLELNEDRNNIYIIIKLLYPYTNGKKETNIPSGIFSIIEDFVSEKKNIERYEINDIVEDFDEETEGLLIKIKDDSSGIDEILAELRKQNIDFEIITNNVKTTETGAGNTFSEIILYIQNTVLDGVVSGAAWDITKIGFLALISRTGNSGSIDEIRVANIKYKKLLKSIGMRVKMKPKDLVLINSYKNNNETIFEFKGNNSNITVICAEDYTILELNLEEKEINNQEA